MKKNNYLLFPLALIIILSSCKKEYSEQSVFEQKIDQSKVFVTPSTPEEKLLVVNLGKVTDVLKELYKDNSNLKVVNAAIFSKAYTDQSVLLKDLIFPDDSRLNIIPKFKLYAQKFNVSLYQFSDNFWIEVNKSNDDSFIKFLNNLNNKKNLNLQNGYVDENGDEVSVYFPYMEEFPDPNDGGGYYEPITSIATATADADEGWGSQPYYVNGVLQYYSQVLVDDEYAEQNPTQIIGVNGIEPYNEPPIQAEGFLPGPPIDLPGLPREVKQVYVGEVKCIHQYDRLISFTGNGGGSEIRFTRADGFLKFVDGQVQADVFIIGDKTISRYNIRKKNFVDYSSEWDVDWEDTNLQQNLAIYENDNRNSSTISGSLSTTLTLGQAPTVITGTGTIGFSINFKSDDALIKQINYNRDVFFVLNRIDLGGGMKNGWPIRDANTNVSYTLQDRTYF